MMEINRHNYEAFLMDLLEGRLSAEDRQRLDDFLLLNPDCTIGLDDVEPWFLETGKIEYQHKNRLRKSLPGPSTELCDHNFDLFSIARMEGDLTGGQERAYQDLTATDPDRSREWVEWQRTRLAPRRIIYKGKDELKRKNTLGNRMIWISILSTAAAVALLFVLFRSGPGLMPPEQTGTLSPSTVDQADENTEATEAPAIQEATGAPSDTEMAGAPSDTEVTETPKIQKVAEVRTTPDEPATNPNIQVPTDKPVRDFTDPEPLTSVQRLNTYSPAGGPVPDEIGSLDVKPVPVHLNSLSIAQLSDMDLRDFIDNYREEKNISFWTIANAGINGINKLAGSDISLMEARDDTGEVSGFQLRGKRFSVTRPIGQNE